MAIVTDIPGDLARQLAAMDAPATVAATQNGTPRDRRDPDELGSWSPRDLVEVGTAPVVAPSIINVFYSARRHMVFGAQSSAKTWLAAVAVTDVIQSQENAIWIDVDGGSSGDLLERLRQLGLRDDQISRHLSYVAPDELLSTQRAATIAGYCRDRDVAIAIVDSATGSMAQQGLDPNGSIDVERWWQQVGSVLIGNRAAVILTDHTGNAQEAAHRASGSARKGQAVDAAFKVTATQGFGRGRTGRSRIVVAKDRPAFHPPIRSAIGTLVLHSDATTHRISWHIESAPAATESDYFRPTRLMERVSDYLAGYPGTHTRREIAAAVTGNADGKKTAISVLVREGYASEAQQGQALLVEHVKAYREANDAGTRHETATASPLPDRFPTASEKRRSTTASRFPYP
jgi:hypothetical protein